MEKNSIPDLINLQNEEDRKLVLDQYKLILDSLNKINDVREASNNFWIGINIALLGAVSYIRDTRGIEDIQKHSFAFTIILTGIVVSICWVSYLVTIKKRINIRNKMATQIEKQLPVKFITIAANKKEKGMGASSLSYKEMAVPIFFLAGYLVFAFLIYIYPTIIAPSI